MAMPEPLTEAGLKVGLDFSEPSSLSQSHPHLSKRESLGGSPASLCPKSSSELQPGLIPERGCGPGTPLQTGGDYPQGRRNDTWRLQERVMLWQGT